MRPELNQLATIDNYLNGKLSEDQKTLFEKKLASDKDFRQKVEDQIALRKGVERIALKEEVTKARKKYGKGKGFGKGLIIGLTLLALASALWFTNSSDKSEDVSNVEVIDKKPLPQEKKEFTADTTLRKEKPKPETQKRTPSLVKKVSTVKIQSSIIRSNEKTVIVGEKGTRITFLPNIFEADGDLEVKLKEYTEIADIVLEGLSTTSEGRFIETAGMIDIRVYKNNKEVKLKAGKEFKIERPVLTKKRVKAKTFYADSSNGKLNWELDEAYIFNNYPSTVTFTKEKSLVSFKIGPDSDYSRFDTYNYSYQFFGQFTYSKKEVRKISELAESPSAMLHVKVDKGKLVKAEFSSKSITAKKAFKRYLSELDHSLLLEEGLTYEFKMFYEDFKMVRPSEIINQVKRSSGEIKKSVRKRNNERNLDNYVIRSDRTGFINVDAFVNFKGNLFTQNVTSPGKGKVSMIVKYKPIYISESTRLNNNFSFPALPMNLPVIFVYYESFKDKFKVIIRESSIGEEKDIELKNSTVMTKNELKEKLISLKGF